MCFLIPFAAFYSVSLLFLTCEDIENLNGMAPIVKKIISTSLAPKPIGPYNQVVIVERTVYLSGVVGVNVSNGKLVPGGVIPETIKALENIQSLLRLAGSHVDNVIKCTVLLKDINDFSAVNQEYTKGWLEVFHKKLPQFIVFIQF